MSTDFAPTHCSGALPSPNRLKKRGEFKAAANGRRFHTEYFTMQTVQREDSGQEAPLLRPRFGLTVTKKAGSAVERNRMRRRFRHALAACMETARTDCDYVLIVRRPALGVDYAILIDALTAAMKRNKPRPAGFIPDKKYAVPSR